MVNWLYNFFIVLYGLGIRIFSLFSNKASLWVNGRKGWTSRLKTINTNGKQVVWMHSASLGEFEQGRPVLEALKVTYPDLFVVITFFSPSGYENRKNYKGADAVLYLPLDTPSNAKLFVDMIKPDLVLWIKYEFWKNYLTRLRQHDVPTLLLSANFSTKGKLYNTLRNSILKSFSHIFVQNEKSALLLETNDFLNVTVAGDTRFDRVKQTLENFEPLEQLGKFATGFTIVAGSTWPTEESMFAELLATQNVKLIIAPHEVDAHHIAQLQKKFTNAALWSAYNEDTNRDNTVLIIDRIGLLSKLYYYADITYVGGGFGNKGLHNILEAAVFGKPVLFGPHYEKNDEAYALIAAKGGFSFGNYNELKNIVTMFKQNKGLLDEAGSRSFTFVQSNTGATKTILDYIYKNRLLTN